MKVEFARGYIDSNKKSDNYFYVNNCGYYLDTDISITTQRPDGRCDYQLIFVSEGQVLVFINGKTVILNKGNFYVFPPFVPQAYKTAQGVNSSYYWIHFSGAECEKIMKDCNISSLNLGELNNIDKCIANIKKVISAIHEGYNETYINSFALKFLSDICEHTNKTRFSKVIKQMNSDIEHHIFDNDYAEIEKISRFYFIRLFKEEFGITPAAYFNNLRLEKGKFMLIETDMKICDIAKELGFYDQFYFSKSFKKYTGVSPLEYRNIN